MRKTITTLLTATTLLGAGAQPAAADDWQASYRTESGASAEWGDYTRQICSTPYRTGVWGQYGAWGNYVDGCTVRRQCEWDRCKVVSANGKLFSHEEDYQSPSSKKTCNVRMRVYDAYGNLQWHRDGSGTHEGTYAWWCYADAGYAWGLRRGAVVTVQANGVRDGMPGSAKVVAMLELVRQY